MKMPIGHGLLSHYGSGIFPELSFIPGPIVYPPAASGSLSDLTLTQNVAMLARNLATGFTGSGNTYALAPSSAALPAGLTLSGAGLLSGTPTALVTAISIVMRAANVAGYADQAFSLTVTDALPLFTAEITAPSVITVTINTNMQAALIAGAIEVQINV